MAVATEGYLTSLKKHHVVSRCRRIQVAHSTEWVTLVAQRCGEPERQLRIVAGPELFDDLLVCRSRIIQSFQMYTETMPTVADPLCEDFPERLQ